MGSSGGVTCKEIWFYKRGIRVRGLKVLDYPCTYLHAYAAVERYLDGIAVIRCLHEGGEVTDADLLQRRLSPAVADAHAGKALSQGRGSTEQDIVVDLQEEQAEEQPPRMALISGY